MKEARTITIVLQKVNSDFILLNFKIWCSQNEYNYLYTRDKALQLQQVKKLLSSVLVTFFIWNLAIYAAFYS